MTRTTTLRHEFVIAVPLELDEGVLYISVEYATALHLCCCGCGTEVVTPLSPTDWRITYDGATVSVCPSIGNWSLPCRSHYWIDEGRVLWSGNWTKRQVERGREADRLAKRDQYDNHSAATGAAPLETPRPIGRLLVAARRTLRLLPSRLKDRTRD